MTPQQIDHVNRRAHLGKLKNGEIGFAHFSKALRDDLANLAPTNDLVFGYKSHHSVNGGWANICKDVGIDRVPPHQAGRHSLATALPKAGWQPKDIANAGSWKSVRLIQDIYVHTEGKSPDAADFMAE